MPEAPADAPSLDRVAVAFVRLLRRAGLEVPVGATITFAHALGAIGGRERSQWYWAGRATLVRRPEDIDGYDRAFATMFEGTEIDLAGSAPREPEIAIAFDSGDDAAPDGAGSDADDVPVLTVQWSPTEVLRQRDFAAYSAAEYAEARRLMADLRLAGALRRSRRPVSTRRARGRPDVRRTVRAAMRSGGEPIRRAHLTPGTRPRRLVLLLDVSGSMEPYARAFVRFLHAAVVGRSKVEAFALGTRLTRITRELSTRDPDAAVAAAARRVHDWSGGTRLGVGIRHFNDEWGVRGMARGAVVVILSDGWDRGDPAVLGEQMERLRRVAFRVVWVNPLKATPGYAPLAQGMAAALAHVDAFVEGHSIAALEDLATVISRP